MDKLCYIAGEWVGQDLEKVSVNNPANGEVVGTVPNASTDEATRAIDAAHEAFQEWSQTTAYERSNYLEKLFNLMHENEDELAEIMALEMGKPMNDSIGEVKYAASFIKWFAEEGKRVYGRTIPSDREGKKMRVRKQPVGVVGAITPWNFPAAMITRKLAPALAAGCTFVVKPPNETPLTAIKLMELCEEAGIPKGVVNLVTGDAEKIGDEILTNNKVRKFTFTGSTEVGIQLLKKGADQVMKMSMELGGHAPAIILDDADIETAARGVLASKFRNSGQTCIASNRIYVQDEIYDDFIKRFKELVDELKTGDPLSKDTDIGPLIHEGAYDKVKNHVDDALEKGAELVIGGEGDVKNGGFYFPPTILKDVTPDMLIMNEETFGPIAPIQKITNDEEAIQYANHTPYGLAAYIFTENYRRADYIIEQLDFGIIGWNDGVPSAAQAPFGGMKRSGIGREGSKEGIEEFLETKYVSVGY
ncbi:NAD-dependent succinate-semialdehyde dehydrogenase [Tenuibacillus multivorans]|uniref:Aldehyde dehydrogenase n=1 Tax=Tenuibacillus multivorans TaxID=237069 RepID=A0A1H0FIB8_9BACI|nr:NAD-dependent succinate-semialdehyde dehydrogenase [Tenuibacillus multivorans]GEL77676.1 NAD-dependent succinate-semialdehyde dehydrogenase [Tenuibacillus multivorans]SDN94370.1 succinate-semialdehyde dehydrogenase / glutarate-semialdehyde dehydrogenase [Tenuibacillus multivorans]